jgi:hypothetical protein
MSERSEHRRPRGWYRRFLRMGVVLGVLGIAVPILMGDARFIIPGVVSLGMSLLLSYPDRVPSKLLTRAENVDAYLWERPFLLALLLLASIIIPATFLILRFLATHPP